MLIALDCPQCGATSEIGAKPGGTSVDCLKCGAALTVPQKELAPGTTVGGFRIEGRLGEGAMGAVFLARQLSMDRMVALKVLPPHLTIREECVTRFLHEACTLARLEHPNIVTAHEAGEDDGVHYMAMAYVQGDSLAVKLEREGAMAEKRALEIVQKTASALGYAWEDHQILHRDVKPSNILLDQHGEPKVADLGLSKVLGEDSTLTLSGTVVGTPNYMSPEQSMGDGDLDFRTDMYALGATLYHMVTGQVPFRGTSVVDVLRKQVSETLPDPRTINAEVSEPCVSLLEVMLAKDRDQRHGDWGSLAADIDRVLEARAPSRALPGPGASMLMRSGAACRAVGHKKPVLGQSTVVRRDMDGEHPAAKTKTTRRRARPWIAGAAAGLTVVVFGVVAVVVRKSREADAGPQAAPAAEQADVSATLDQVRPTVRSHMDQATVDEAMQKLKRDNPDMGDVPDIRVDPDGTVAWVDLDNQRIADISGLAGLPIRRLDLKRCTQVDDLSPLRGMPLVSLDASTAARIHDLVPLAGMPLEELAVGGQVTDLRPLQGMPLRSLVLASRLIEDLSPLKGMELEKFVMTRGRVTDLRPLLGMPLTSVNVGDTPVADLTPLRGMPLHMLRVDGSKVTDLSPLAGMRLQTLYVYGTDVHDLSPLQGMESMKTLYAHNTKVTDLTPLEGMGLLYSLTFTPKNITRGIDVVRGMELRSIGEDLPTMMPAAEFWQKYDAGEFTR